MGLQCQRKQFVAMYTKQRDLWVDMYKKTTKCKWLVPLKIQYLAKMRELRVFKKKSEQALPTI